MKTTRLALLIVAGAAAYSQTISPSLVTSKKRPNEASLINVLPFGRR